MKTTLSVAEAVRRVLLRGGGAAVALLCLAVVLSLAIMMVQQHRVRDAIQWVHLADANAERTERLARLAPLVGADPAAAEAYGATLDALRADFTTLAAAARGDAVLQKAYAGQGYSLTARAGDFFTLAERLKSPAEAQDVAAAVQREAAGPLAAGLHDAVVAHDRVARRRLDRVRGSIIGEAAGLLLLLAALAWIGARPLLRRLEHAIALMERLAARDSLTGAMTRNAFLALLRRMLDTDSGTGLVLLDLDRFGAFNAANGDAAADAALRITAQRLRDAAGPDASVARLGSDSFAVAFPGIETHAALDDAAYRLLESLHPPLPYDRRMLHVSATAGTALAPNDSQERGDLLRLAEVALREAKTDLRGSVRAFRSADPAAQQRREALLRTLANGDLRGVGAWLQPILRCADLRPIGFEALARWDHPELGRISPAEFIPVAEASGILPLLAATVRATALETVALLRADGLPDARIEINLTAGEVARPDTVRELRRALRDIGLPASVLQLDVTEATLLDPPDAETAGELQALRTEGARLALDDFGLGFASLQHLLRFTVDAIKIDRSFISRIGAEDPETSGPAEAIVRSIIGLARGLGIETVAEGVETTAQHAFLRGQGCDVVQGYLFGAPMAPAEIRAWARGHRIKAR